MKKIILLLLLALNLSCNNNKKLYSERVITLAPNIEDYPSFVESNYSMSFNIIPLELTEKSTISNIVTLIINNNYIYILDMNATLKLLIFTKEGKFIKELERGKAKNELIGTTFFNIDRKTNNIEVLDRQTVLKIYSETGEFIKTIDFKFAHNEFAHIGNQYILYNANAGKKNGENYFSIYNTENEEMNFYIKHCAGNDLAHFLPNHFSYNKDYVYFNSNFNDKIYRMSELDIEPQVFAQVTNVFDGIGMKDMNSDKIKSICGNKEFSFFTSFNILLDGDLFHLFVNKIDQLYSIFYDTKENKAYKSIFEGLPYFTLLHSTNNKSYHEFNPASFERIDKNKLPKELYEIMNKRYLEVGFNDNMYIIEVTYSKK